MELKLSKKELMQILKTKFNYEITNISMVRNYFKIDLDVNYYDDGNEINVTKTFSFEAD